MVQVDTSVAPTAPLEVPAAQSVQLVLLSVVAYFPAAQPVHVGEPSASANRPGTQSVQSVASSAASETRPAAQRSQPNVAAALSLTNQPGPQTPSA